ncbi:MAG: aminotransferase-like domain-containing protein, partial [Candidatus Limnocylindrales bacterium]
MTGPIRTRLTGPIEGEPTAAAASALDFEPTIPPGVGLTTGIYRAVVDAIVGGRFEPGDRLPAARDLARRLGIARNTVVSAYDQLVAEGFLVTSVGAGTFVSDEAPAGRLPNRAPHGRGVVPRPVWVSRGPGLGARHERARIDFSVGVPDPALFPLTAWRRLVAGALRPERLQAGYADAEGDPDLRLAIARRVGAARSIRAAAGDIVVTNGGQQAIDLIGRVLLGPGDVVAVEEPGYPPARRAFGATGARVVPTPVDREGIVVEALPHEARLVYVTPSHQFPLGMAMSLRRRSALLDWAGRRGAVILEDDYDSEFRFGGRP